MKSSKLFFGLFLLFCSTYFKANSQYVFIPDNTGKQLSENRYENITGSPYFIDEWLSGEVKLSNGKIIKLPALKYDIVKDNLLFQDNQKTFEFYPLCAAFSLNASDGVKTFLYKDNQGYYQLLVDGQIQLLKKTKKTILEVKGYNAATIEKTVDEHHKYFIIFNGNETELKLNKKNLIESLPSLKEQIEVYLSKISTKLTEENLMALIKHLNKR